MKKATTLILLFSFAIVAKAQEDIYKIIATETCECVSKRNIDTSKRNEVEMALGLCMLESIRNHEVDIEISDDKAMTAFGEKVGLQMAPICPNIFGVFMQEDEIETTSIEVTGKVKSIESDGYLYVILKEDSGKEHKLLWFRYFSGSDDFKDDPKKLVGKNVTMTYQEVECYFPKLKSYYKNKEIIDLKLNK